MAWRIAKIALQILKWFLIVTISWVIILRWINPPFTFLMAQRQVSLWFSDEKDKSIYKEWVDIEDMSKHMPIAVMSSEDDNFLTHHGFDFEAINRAVKYNETHKKKMGASTISQQVAKNVFLFPSRNFIRKGFEAYFTVLIELFWSKKRIMEVYLNVVEQNDNRFGVEAAARHCYGIAAKKMNRYQCARLAAILPSPRRFSAKYPSGYVLLRQSQIALLITYHPQYMYDAFK
jgi:monofunctional biosynthetic peptidoglycan transglycosylase